MLRRLRLVIAVIGAIALVVSSGSAASAHGKGGGSSKPVRRIVLEGNGLGVVSLGVSERTAVAAVDRALGKPSDRPPSGCGPRYGTEAWHDLLLEFERGRFVAYRYWVDNGDGELSAPEPKLATSRGITIGDTFAQVRAVYTLRQSGTNFWTTDGLTFDVSSPGYPSPPSSPIVEIKTTTACPPSV